MMANMGGFEHACALAVSGLYRGLGAGVHLVLTGGSALTGIRSTLTDKNGVFNRQAEFFERVESGRIDYAEMETELRAQIERVAEAGVRITHIDSHHHFHLRKGPFDVVRRLADEAGLPLRAGTKEDIARDFPGIRSTERFSMDFYGDNLSEEVFIGILERHKTAESLEVMAHPAYLDKPLIDASGYTLPRTEELAILTSKKTLDYITSNDVVPTNYRELFS
jgi:predicted glycoside hydrolase/deacetylase ChbG (UPF0249 family)